MTNPEQSFDDGNISAITNRASPHPLSPSPQVTPGSALFFASLPLGLGAYIGYRRALHESQLSSSATAAAASSSSPQLSNGRNHHHEPSPRIISSGGNNTSSPLRPLASNTAAIAPTTLKTTITATTPPPILAARALAIGSLLSISGTALLVSGIFYVSGCQSLEEFISTLQVWAPKQLHRLETSFENNKWLGSLSSVGKERREAKLEYERSVRGMTEEEELEYVKKKYSQELNWEDNDKSETNVGKGR